VAGKSQRQYRIDGEMLQGGGTTVSVLASETTTRQNVPQDPRRCRGFLRCGGATAGGNLSPLCSGGGHEVGDAEPHTGYDGLERHRAYLVFLARLQLNQRLQAKVDLSGIVQQTLLEAHLAKDQLRDQPSEQRLAWLRRVLAHNLADEIRKIRSQKRSAGRERSLQAAIERSSLRLEAWIAADGSAPHARLERQERAVQLAAALNRLPEAQREALVLQHWKGWSLAEIAEHMGRTRAAVAGLLKRGLSQLRVEMRDSRQD
jgi:RNA polymerase sigma-70 factor (ECF subfamily)